MSERECLPLDEMIKNNPQEFGLKLENSDIRRSIFLVVDQENFLARSGELGIDVVAGNKIREYFIKYPKGLIQFFVINKPENGTIKLGNHYHTAIDNGGNGVEVFVFTDVPQSTNVKLEQYNLGRATGQIRYNVKTGAVMENRAEDYHVIESDGPFKMVQVLEGEFKASDLNKLNQNSGSQSDNNLVFGRSRDVV